MNINFSDCEKIGFDINCLCLSKKVTNIRTPLVWLCANCNNKFTESYINIKNNNRGCLKCSYKKFNKK